MNSFSIQAIKDTLHDIQGVITSKVIPAVGTFLGHSVTVISANPLATAAVVAAVITVSLVVFATYKHYQFHQQLKAKNAFLNESLKTEKDNNKLVFESKDVSQNITGPQKRGRLLVNRKKPEILENRDFEKENVILKKEKEYYINEKEILEKENGILASKIEEALETGNWAVECQNSEIENKTNSLKEAYQELNTLCKVKDEMDKEISRRKKDKKVYKQAAEELVTDLQLEIKILKNKIAVK